MSRRPTLEQLTKHFETLTDEQRRGFYEKLRNAIPLPYRSKYGPRIISPKQEAFLITPQVEVLFGGAAGGGKSAAILLGALQYADQPRYSALLLRRSLAELEMPRALIPLSKEWLAGTDAVWHEQKKQWTFPKGGVIVMRYLDRDDDKWQFQSAAFNYIGIDEAAEFPLEDTYTFLFSRLRRGAGETIPGRMRLAANPIGPGANWLKRRFLTTKDDTRLYLPSVLEDNPFIDQEDYDQSLKKLNPYHYQAIRRGDWDAKPPGKMFQRQWFKLAHSIPMDAVARVRFWDLAATQEDKKKNPSWTCGVRMSYLDGIFTIEDVRRVRETPGTVRELVKQTAVLDGPNTEIWIEQEPGSAAIALIQDYIKALPRFCVRPFKVSAAKPERAAPFASQAEAGNVRIIEADWNEAYIEELEQFPSHAWKNDQVDGSSGAYQVLANHIQQYGDDLGISVGGGRSMDFSDLT